MRIIQTGIDFLSQVGAEIFAAKMALENSISFSNDALHVIVGVLFQLIAAFALRSSLRSLGPWLMVLALELANEFNDLHVEIWPNLGDQLGEGAKDILLTMFLPTMLLIVARSRPNLLVRRG